MAIFACKLPHGLQISHGGKTIVLRGANIGESIALVSPNGLPADNADRSHGYGLTTVPDDHVEAFNDWANAVTYKNGKAADGKLQDPFAALENGSILGPFKTMTDARKECESMATAVKTGFEGLDAEKEAGIEENKDAKSGK